MEKASDFGGNKVDNAYCVFCSDENGNLSVSFEDVVNFYTKDFVKRRGLDSTRAKQIASETVARFPAWSGNS
ncbi:MAG: hypothetical protein MI748_01510 [Opitutales bacterium]|nr:hypothetical protein [Opitutales bacterium]